jgi:NitT/TauT family transport system permease protein
VLQVVSVLLGLLLWQIASLGVSRFILPPPLDVVRRLGDPAYLGQLAVATLSSASAMLVAFAAAIAAAVPIGLAIGRSPRLRAAAEPVVNGLYAVPPVALTPFVIIWLGLVWQARLALIFLMCFPDMLVVAIAGARDIPRSLDAVGRSFGASRWQFVRLVLLPASLPFLFAALRVGAARAINGMITAELFLAAVNLGRMLKASAEAFDNGGVFVVVVLVCLLGLTAQWLVRRLEARILHWQAATAR